MSFAFFPSPAAAGNVSFVVTGTSDCDDEDAAYEAAAASAAIDAMRYSPLEAPPTTATEPADVMPGYGAGRVRLFFDSQDNWINSTLTESILFTPNRTCTPLVTNAGAVAGIAIGAVAPGYFPPWTPIDATLGMPIATAARPTPLASSFCLPAIGFEAIDNGAGPEWLIPLCPGQTLTAATCSLHGARSHGGSSLSLWSTVAAGDSGGSPSPPGGGGGGQQPGVSPSMPMRRSRRNLQQAADTTDARPTTTSESLVSGACAFHHSRHLIGN